MSFRVSLERLPRRFGGVQGGRWHPEPKEFGWRPTMVGKPSGHSRGALNPVTASFGDPVAETKPSTLWQKVLKSAFIMPRLESAFDL